MRVLVIYESMYGNTMQVAQSIAAGLRGTSDVRLVPVADAFAESLAGYDLVVVGGPTHAWSLSRAATRQSAVRDAPAKGLQAEPDAGGLGLRDWLDTLSDDVQLGAVFDTRLKAPSVATGRASVRLGRQLRRRGWQLIDPAESFLVTRDNRLIDGELARAQQWGRQLAEHAGRRLADNRRPLGRRR
jgi:hypothetical protein